ncbi:uncharacterized protein MYCGRDRAFT_111065 [Zymoseptoria tritici IPO323]|uniref:Uncharacterized protein n=1 Tax=Zymoseptoria tritici (strain CBS 115943 / IPO323) TaxID=336722 RepID=F9XL80_ZYMTI|nr:uncharacterized protein MYCGRDRAFT_111065 [Zymoseptoria tritici IPO323]EGP83872.1 hypothetical protein MYCGRDRAFT_111065 [Zymoseptoria tritici IPO323]
MDARAELKISRKLHPAGRPTFLDLKPTPFVNTTSAPKACLTVVIGRIEEKELEKMALNVGARPMANGHTSPTQAEEEQMYDQLLRVRDAVLAGSHPQFKLSAAAIERLKALSNTGALAAGPEQRNNTADMNGSSSLPSSNATNRTQQPPPSSASSSALPGLHAVTTPSRTNGAPPRRQSSAQFNPLFLEKAESLVKAEAMIKRRNLEAELRAQVDRRNNMRDRDAINEMGPLALDHTAILNSVLARIPHVSGFAPDTRPESAGASTSFDENDYYSSQVESEWSSPASSSKPSDRAADASRAAAGQSAPTAPATVSGKAPLVPQQASASQAPFEIEDDDDDDEYAPPDASAFDAFDDNSGFMDITQDTQVEDDDDSDYEPGEITQDSNAATPYQSQLGFQSSPRVPIIRNHLTHLAAPQPNRVSPLAVAKGPNIELELINGRPEVVHKPRTMQNMPSRASTASPPGQGANNNNNNKKRRNKKRKRDSEPSSKSKKKRDRNPAAISPPSPMYREPRIKDEPVSPPPYGQLAEVPVYQQRPPHLELVPRQYPTQVQYIEQPQSGLRYEYAQPSPTVVRVASPAAHRPAQRDNQDLRRVASLHLAQRPQSPTQQFQSPGSQRTVSMTYADPRYSRSSMAPVDVRSPQYQDQPPVQYVHAEHYRSSPQTPQYHDPYARAQSPAMMPPPAAPARPVVYDQHGNRYYAAEPAPAPRPRVIASRASVAPVELGYERSQSRMATGYGMPLPAPQYDPADPRMGPPPTPSRRQTSEVQYVDAQGYPVQRYPPRPVEPELVRYIKAPTSPVYQSSSPRYGQMPPPSAPPAPTSPMYVPQRSYSVRPEEISQPPGAYARQASVAPTQYARPDAAPMAGMRAMSVMPGYDHGAIALPRAYSQAPPPQAQPVKYYDENGQEVYPREIRQVPQEYRYQ